MEHHGLHPGLYDEVGSLEFQDHDEDGDGFVNAIELQKLFREIFNNKMGLVVGASFFFVFRD